MIVYYPLFDDDTKKGPIGPPGIGFKLTNDGNFDMENKILKNCKNPIDNGDVTTKSFVLDKLENNYFELNEEIEKNKLKLDNDLKELNIRIIQLDENTLHIINGKNIDAKGKRIGNVADPKDDKNVVNKRYLEKTLKERFILTRIDKDKHDKHEFIFKDNNSDFFETGLKLKYSMTMKVTFYFKTNVQSRKEIRFFVGTKRLEFIFEKKGSLHCEGIMSGSEGESIKVTSEFASEKEHILEPILLIQILEFSS